MGGARRTQAGVSCPAIRVASWAAEEAEVAEHKSRSAGWAAEGAEVAEHESRNASLSAEEAEVAEHKSRNASLSAEEAEVAEHKSRRAQRGGVARRQQRVAAGLRPATRIERHPGSHASGPRLQGRV